MPHYFFHFFDGQGWAPDEDGIAFDSADHALADAYKGARQMWPDLIADRIDPLDCAFDIAGEDGEVLFHVPFREITDRCRTHEPLPPIALTVTLKLTHERAIAARRDLWFGIGEVREALCEAKSLISRLDALCAPMSKGPAFTADGP